MKIEKLGKTRAKARRRGPRVRPRLDKIRPGARGETNERSENRLASGRGLRDAFPYMANWEYKVISSGKGGFASPTLMEKFINDLGQDQWEIINFHPAPDNPLAFTGLARRTTLRDWTLEDAVAAAARAETDKLRVEFEAKFKAASTGAAAATEEKAESFLEEKAGPDDGFRRPVDTSRDEDPDAPAEDEWQKLSSEDELPTFFDALKPHMRRNQRGPGMSVGLDFLAKKWKFEESDIKTALVECGMSIPADENAKPVVVEYDGDIFWVNINRRGEIWINTREKPDPVFRIVPGKRLTDEETAVVVENTGGGFVPSRPVAAEGAFDQRETTGPQASPAQERREQTQPRQPQGGDRHQGQPSAPKTLLGKIRGMMRRNHRGHGWSGSFPYLTKALKLDEAQLLAELEPFGVKLPAEGETKPVLAAEGDFVYWLNKNQRGEIWINAQLARDQERMDRAQRPDDGGSKTADPVKVETSAPPVAAKTLPPENTLTAVRLLMQPKKRGEGVTATIKEIAEKLEKSEDQLMAVLASAGLNLPAAPKDKPTFAEHGGEVFWLNANAKGQVWVNAKPTSATKKSRGKKSDE